MATPTKRKLKVLEAEYVETPDSILILGECSEGRFRTQIHSECFTFGDKDKAIEMQKTAKLMIGKTITMVFDPDLNERIDANAPINY